jgi:hypothetical protein
VTTVVRLGAWCDFVTEDEYRQRLIRDGWRAPVERKSGARAHPAPFAPGSTEEVDERFGAILTTGGMTADGD